MGIRSVLSVVFPILVSVASATDTPAPVPAAPPAAPILFVDFDGDGINDNFVDANRDGIPDAPEPIASPAGIFSGDTRFASPSFALAARNSDVFNQRLSRLTCLTLNRGGFGSAENFGPGNGISAGAVSSGTCVGGVCH